MIRKQGRILSSALDVLYSTLLNYENIVNLIEICRQYSRHKTKCYFVFDFCEHDLAGLLSNINVKSSLGEIKKVMQQMSEGLFFINDNKSIHMCEHVLTSLILIHYLSNFQRHERCQYIDIKARDSETC